MALIEQVGVKNSSGVMVDPSTEETLNELKRILQLLKPLGIVTGLGSNRLNIDVNNITTLPTLALVTTVTTVTTVGNVANQTLTGNVNSFMQIQGQMRMAAQLGIFNNITGA